MTRTHCSSLARTSCDIMEYRIYATLWLMGGLFVELCCSRSRSRSPCTCGLSLLLPVTPRFRWRIGDIRGIVVACSKAHVILFRLPAWGRESTRSTSFKLLFVACPNVTQYVCSDRSIGLSQAIVQLVADSSHAYKVFEIRGTHEISDQS